MTEDKRKNVWDDERIDVTAEANFIWSIANKLRGSYMPDKYGDVIIPMTIIRRFECALTKTKKKVVEQFKKNPDYPAKAMERISGYQFYNTSDYDLAELCNDHDNIAANFKEYISGFSANVQDILNELEMNNHIDKMNKDGCLYNTVKAFSELDLSVETFDSIKMGYVFEDLMGRFYQNVDAGQFYTGRDIIKMMVSVLMAEGCDDIFDKGKVITICDQACGTGGMLSTAYSYIKQLNPSADVRLFGQEYMGVSYAMGLAEMLIKGQNAENFRHADTFKDDCFQDVDMRFVIENPPFGTPWSGKDAKAGQEEAVKEEYKKGFNGRWGAGLPGGGDSQMLFLQSAVAKMDDKLGRAAIIENGSPLFTGGTASGESQIRRWLLEQDLIEAIIAMPTDLFYNTGIATYVWILSKNKKEERKGKVQLIDATQIYHKLRKPLGNKKNEFNSEDRAMITRLYADFEENEVCKIFDNTEFIYREYTIMQPLQRSYAITEERIQNMIQLALKRNQGALKKLWDGSKVMELEEKGTTATAKEQNMLEKFYMTKPIYDGIIKGLRDNISEKKWLSLESFKPVLEKIMSQLFDDNKLLDQIADDLSVMDKEAEVQYKKGKIIYDDSARYKDSEIVKWDENIDDYMEREVLPHLPDAKWFFEEKLGVKTPIIKTGAEIPFTRYFYKYQQPEASEVLAKKFCDLEKNVKEQINKLFE